MIKPVTRTMLGRACACLLLVAVTALAGAGCGGKKKPVLGAGVEPDKYLFDQGTDALNKRRFIRAREYFRQIVDNYPQSRYRPDAKLGLADTYLGDGSAEALVLGGNEFREFLTFYPTHDRAYYAQYKLALSHFQQMAAAQRDQTQTRDALKEFEAFLEKYPDTPLTQEGRQKLQVCKDRLSDADYDVGYFYYRSRWLPGAIARLRTILKDNPTYGRRDAVYYYLADAYVRVGLTPEAPPLLDRLKKEFEKSEFLLKGAKLAEDVASGNVNTGGKKNDKKNKGGATAKPVEPEKPAEKPAEKPPEKKAGVQ